MLLAAAILLPHLVSAPPIDAVKLPKPGVLYRVNVASASARPWVVTNGWRLERGGSRPFFYDVTGEATGLAAAEAFAYQREVAIHADASGTAAFDRILTFLKSIGEGPLMPLANAGVVDDGSPQTGEVMNLLVRHNLLFRILSKPDAALPVNIQLGTPEYPKAAARNPEDFAQQVRERITDEKRIVRIYGSEVVLARVCGDLRRLRVHLINYSERPVYGIRVRVLGMYAKGETAAFGGLQELKDYDAQFNATEFTLPELKRYAVVDLSSPSGAGYRR